MYSWLKENKEFLSIKAIGDHLHKTKGVPKDVLPKYVQGRRKIPSQWQTIVNEFVKELKK